MRARLQASPQSHEGRLQVAPFDLADTEWRTRLPDPLRCVLASLIVHHLNADGKRHLFSDIASRLEPGGAFIMIDLVEPTSSQARDAYSRQWDEDVRPESKPQAKAPRPTISSETTVGISTQTPPPTPMINLPHSPIS